MFKGLKHGKYELWNIPWGRGLYTSENIQGTGVGVSCFGNVVEYCLWMSFETTVILEAWP